MRDFGIIPRHIAIIMDGNGRWAKKMGKDRLYGHKYGIETVRKVIKAAIELGVEYLTLYAFSTENWGRDPEEVAGLMRLMSEALINETHELSQNGVKMRFIGDVEGLPEDVQSNIKAAEAINVPDQQLSLVIAINYSSRWEITDMVKRIVRDGYSTEEIDEGLISSKLQTKDMPDPELLIRTSGEQRLSNFLLWQLSYTELYFTSVHWPEFDKEEFLKAIEEYNRRERRFGLTK